MKVWRGDEFVRAVPRKRLFDLDAFEDDVRMIIRDVRNRGDEALIEYAARFDGLNLRLGEIQVSAEEISQAYRAVDEDFIRSLKVAMENIQRYYEQQLSKSWMTVTREGTVLGKIYIPVEKAGIYVPGGTARYPSSVLMTALPAKVAGVKETVMCTPAASSGKVDPHVLVAADLAGVKRVFRVGGAQAIAAMAFGTESIPPVDMIVGPGNVYVTVAKKLVYGQVGIDMLAGPSEIAVLCDYTANPVIVAADLLSQAEHDVYASAILVTASERLAETVQEELAARLDKVSRRDIVARSLENRGAIVLVENMEEGIEVINHYAPEHLELLVEKPFELLGQIKNVGTIFVGPYSAEAFGDYTAGPSHVLPTGGTAKYASGLGIETFLKVSNVVAVSREGFLALKDATKKLAEVEGLDAHKASIETREGVLC